MKNIRQYIYKLLLPIFAIIFLLAMASCTTVSQEEKIASQLKNTFSFGTGFSSELLKLENIQDMDFDDVKDFNLSLYYFGDNVPKLLLQKRNSWMDVKISSPNFGGDLESHLYLKNKHSFVVTKLPDSSISASVSEEQDSSFDDSINIDELKKFFKSAGMENYVKIIENIKTLPEITKDDIIKQEENKYVVSEDKSKAIVEAFLKDIPMDTTPVLTVKMEADDSSQLSKISLTLTDSDNSVSIDMEIADSVPKSISFLSKTKDNDEISFNMSIEMLENSIYCDSYMSTKIKEESVTGSIRLELTYDLQNHKINGGAINVNLKNNSSNEKIYVTLIYDPSMSLVKSNPEKYFFNLEFLSGERSNTENEIFAKKISDDEYRILVDIDNYTDSSYDINGDYILKINDSQSITDDEQVTNAKSLCEAAANNITSIKNKQKQLESLALDYANANGGSDPYNLNYSQSFYVYDSDCNVCFLINLYQEGSSITASSECIIYGYEQMITSYDKGEVVDGVLSVDFRQPTEEPENPALTPEQQAHLTVGTKFVSEYISSVHDAYPALYYKTADGVYYVLAAYDSQSGQYYVYLYYANSLSEDYLASLGYQKFEIVGDYIKPVI